MATEPTAVESATAAPALEAVRDFELGPERPLLLRVMDPGGNPVFGAHVGAGDANSRHGWVPYPLCLTDGSGIARVEHIPRRNQALSVACEMG